MDLLRLGLLVALVTTGGCKREASFVGLYCEGGVDAKGHPQGGACLQVKSEASAFWIGERGETSDLVLTRAGSAYTLHRNGAQVGELTRDDHWLHVTLEQRRYDVRNDMPGVLQ